MRGEEGADEGADREKDRVEKGGSLGGREKEVKNVKTAGQSGETAGQNGW
jgi:hypothetical protein